MVIYITIPNDMIISIIIYIYQIYVICGVISINQNIFIGDPIIGPSMFLVSHSIY